MALRHTWLAIAITLLALALVVACSGSDRGAANVSDGSANTSAFDARKYDQSCTGDADCVIRRVVSSCSTCCYDDVAVRKSSQEEADYAATLAACGQGFFECGIACGEAGVACQAGHCEIVHAGLGTSGTGGIYIPPPEGGAGRPLARPLFLGSAYASPAVTVSVALAKITATAPAIVWPTAAARTTPATAGRARTDSAPAPRGYRDRYGVRALVACLDRGGGTWRRARSPRKTWLPLRPSPSPLVMPRQHPTSGRERSPTQPSPIPMRALATPWRPTPGRCARAGRRVSLRR